MYTKDPRRKHAPRFAEGTRVRVLQDDGSYREAVTGKRGRNREGVYLEVRYDSGRMERVHPGYIE